MHAESLKHFYFVLLAVLDGEREKTFGDSICNGTEKWFKQKR